MHALTILHRILSASLPEIHSKRLASLLAAKHLKASASNLFLYFSSPTKNCDSPPISCDSN
jgi:hypothetical protein